MWQKVLAVVLALYFCFRRKISHIFKLQHNLYIKVNLLLLNSEISSWNNSPSIFLQHRLSRIDWQKINFFFMPSSFSFLKWLQQLCYFNVFSLFCKVCCIVKKKRIAGLLSFIHTRMHVCLERNRITHYLAILFSFFVLFLLFTSYLGLFYFLQIRSLVC